MRTVMRNTAERHGCIYEFSNESQCKSDAEYAAGDADKPAGNRVSGSRSRSLPCTITADLLVESHERSSTLI